MADDTPGPESKLTVERQNQLLGALSAGVPMGTAADFAGVHVDTISRWRRKGEEAERMPPSTRSTTQQEYVEFAVKCRTALAQSNAVAQRLVYRLMSVPEDATIEEKSLALRSAQFHLTHRDPKNYSTRVEMTGADGQPIEVVKGQSVWAKMKAIHEREKAKDEADA